MYGNTKFKLSPVEALKYLNELCYDEYNRGKRKININRVWEIVDAGLPENSAVSTKTIPTLSGNYAESETSTATEY